ncbi:MAG: hypothetical protein ACI9JN_000437 [Bacteroidia bacterium]|jgi:hypothetical protein
MKSVALNKLNTEFFNYSFILKSVALQKIQNHWVEKTN